MTDGDEQKLFLVDLPIITKKHHKWKYILHLRADSGVQKSIMTKKLYDVHTSDKFFNKLDEQESQLKEYGANTSQYMQPWIMQVLPMERPNTIQSYLQDIVGERWTNITKWKYCPKLGLIKCLGSVNTTKDNSKKKTSSNATWKFHKTTRSLHYWSNWKRSTQNWLMNQQLEHSQERSITSM